MLLFSFSNAFRIAQEFNQTFRSCLLHLHPAARPSEVKSTCRRRCHAANAAA